MSKVLILIIVLTTLVVWQPSSSAQTTTTVASTQPVETSEFKTDIDRRSYALGVRLGMGFKTDGIEINPAILVRAIGEVLAGKSLAMDDMQIMEVIADLQKDLMARKQAEFKSLAEKNLAQAKAFLAENAKKKDVKVLPSGLQYKVLTEGTGDIPKATDRVKTHYVGTLIDGTEFDSSYSRGQPAVFGVDRVIPGWTEALQLMKTGAKWQIVIPPELAYKETGAGPNIPPNAALIFELELLGIEPSEPEKPKAEEKLEIIK